MSKCADTIMYEFQADQGWTDQTALELALRYIDSQGNNETFKDFLECVVPPDWDVEESRGMEPEIPLDSD